MSFFFADAVLPLRFHLRLGATRHVLSLGTDRPLDLEPDEIAFRAEQAGVRAVATAVKRANQLDLECRLETDRSDVRIEWVELARLEETRPPTCLRLFHNGWESWSGTSSLPLGRREPRPRGRFIRDIITNPWLGSHDRRGRMTSDLVVAADSGRDAVVMGFTAARRAFGFFVAARDERGATLTAVVPGEGVLLRPGVPWEIDPLTVRRGPRAIPLLESWAASLGLEMGARVGAAPSVGWCSWYYYFTGISDEIIRENLKRLVAMGHELPLELFQIDDGYQAALGEWTRTNAGFPEGMGSLAEAIEHAGLIPGLWLAPFIARREAPILRRHPARFIRNRRGKPRYAIYNPMWGKLGTARALDTTHPEVRDWLREIVEVVTREWGFRFLKLDFLYAAALPGRRHDPHATGVEALSLGLQVIREAAGEDVHLLGCGCPLGPAVGLVDSMRVGPDVAPYWSDRFSRFMGRDYDLPSTKNALRNVLGRAFMHRHLWRNDPDCLLVRAKDTRLTLDEVRTLASMAALSGGTLLVSDNLLELSPERLAIARRAVEINAELRDTTPRALDLMESGFPTLFWGRGESNDGPVEYLAVCNPLERPRARTVKLAAYPELGGWVDAAWAAEIWTGAKVAIRSGEIDLGTLAPHETRLLSLRLSETSVRGQPQS